MGTSLGSFKHESGPREGVWVPWKIVEYYWDFSGRLRMFLVPLEY